MHLIINSYKILENIFQLSAAREGRGSGRWWEGGRRSASHPRDRPDGTRGGKPAGRTPLPHTGRLAVPGGRGAREHALLTGNDDVTSCPRCWEERLICFRRRWNSWMAFLVEVSGHTVTRVFCDSSFVWFSSLIFRFTKCYLWIDLSFPLSRFFVRIF
jgi:hypothetical protein